MTQFNTNNSTFLKVRRAMSPQCEAIASGLKVFPCIHFNQLDYFMPKYFSTYENYGRQIASYLIHANYASLQDDCLFSKDLSSADESLVDLLWVAIDLYKDTPEEISTALRNAVKAKYPCNAIMFKDNLGRYKLMTISSSLDFTKIYTENENYRNADNKEDLSYIIVMRNLDLVDEFAKAKPDFPFKIAGVEGKFGEYPSIKYYELDL